MATSSFNVIEHKLLVITNQNRLTERKYVLVFTYFKNMIKLLRYFSYGIDKTSKLALKFLSHVLNKVDIHSNRFCVTFFYKWMITVMVNKFLTQSKNSV